MSDVVDRLVNKYKAGGFNDGSSLVNLGRNTSLELSMLKEDLQDIELGRLNWSPKVNWVEANEDLPKFITDVAIGIMKGTGYPRERAIPIAISRIKVWARGGGGGVNADTVAKAAAALAAWEALKAKAAVRRARK